MTTPLHIYAGPSALAQLRENGLRPADVSVVAGAAGGPKGLVLSELDRFIFGQWLPQSSQPVDLVGASIGAWRLASACLQDPQAAFERLAHDYVHQTYDTITDKRGRAKFPPARVISSGFAQSLQSFYAGKVADLLAHPRYRLHIITSRGRHVLHRETPLRRAVGFGGGFFSNLVSRRLLGAWFERVVFSSGSAGAGGLPFAARELPTCRVALTEANFYEALQASCSIPFAMHSVPAIDGAPKGTYWDGGMTDYHLHLPFQTQAHQPHQNQGLVLYPHFQQALVPGWFDKALTWRHGATASLDRVVVLAPSPEWVKSLPNGKLPDRNDFLTYLQNIEGRVAAWGEAVRRSAELREAFAHWLQTGQGAELRAL